MLKKILSILILLVCIALFGAFIYLKVGFLGSDTNTVNTSFRSRLASYPILRSLFSLQYDGDAKSDYLTNPPGKILIEADSMEGEALSTDVLSGLSDRIQNSTGKPTSYLISNTDIPYDDQSTDSDIAQIVGTYQNYHTDSDTAVLYLLVLNQKQNQPTLIGSTYQSNTVLVFQRALQTFIEGSGNTLPSYQLSTALHEFGHQMGLPHNNQTGCLMNPEAETGGQPRKDPDLVVTDFCDYERSLIASLKNK